MCGRAISYFPGEKDVALAIIAALLPLNATRFGWRLKVHWEQRKGSEHNQSSANASRALTSSVLSRSLLVAHSADGSGSRPLLLLQRQLASIAQCDTTAKRTENDPLVANLTSNMATRSIVRSVSTTPTTARSVLWLVDNSHARASRHERT